MKVFFGGNIHQKSLEMTGITGVVIVDERGNPVFAALQHTPDNIEYVTVSDPDFSSFIAKMGYKAPEVVIERCPPRLEDY